MYGMARKMKAGVRERSENGVCRLEEVRDESFIVCR